MFGSGLYSRQVEHIWQPLWGRLILRLEREVRYWTNRNKKRLHWLSPRLKTWIAYNKRSMLTKAKTQAQRKALAKQGSLWLSMILHPAMQSQLHPTTSGSPMALQLGNKHFDLLCVSTDSSLTSLPHSPVTSPKWHCWPSLTSSLPQAALSASFNPSP